MRQSFSACSENRLKETFKLQKTDAGLIEKYAQSCKSALKLGDRTCAFICDRDYEIYKDYPNTIKHKIGLLYLKNNSGQMSRIEFPEWMAQNDAIINKIIMAFLAESIIGNGYPYSIDVCHQNVVIKREENEKFLYMFTEFAKKNNIFIRMSNKARSKRVHF